MRRYVERAKACAGVTFVGRLAQYRYYNMDQVVGAALAAAARIVGALRGEAAREDGSVGQADADTDGAAPIRGAAPRSRGARRDRRTGRCRRLTPLLFRAAAPKRMVDG